MNTSLTTADALSLYIQHWPAPSPARGSVLLVHGLGEHIGRYLHVAQHLNDNGWNAVGYDHRGHGRSGGGKGQLKEDDDFLRDLALVIDAVRAAHPGPLVLLGHSLGGLIGARFVAEGLAPTPAPWYRPVDALVLSSPAIDPGMNAAQKMMLSIAEPMAPNLAVNNGLNLDMLSHDKAVVQAYKADPLVHDRVTPRLVRFILDGGETVLERASHWSVPTLLLYAGSDKCVAPRGSAMFAEGAPERVVETHEFPALYHEIFNEPEKSEVFAVLDKWLAKLGH